jgi:hypothetical protein
VSTLSLGAAHAQQAPSLTDRQLQAAYCVGVDQQLMASTQSLMSAPKSLDALIADQKSACPSCGPDYWEKQAKLVHDMQQNNLSQNQDTYKTVDNNRRRFLAYLVATGALANSDNLQSSVGIDLARNQGLADSKECSATMSSRCNDQLDINWGSVSKEELHKATHEWAERQNKCFDGIPACAKQQRCGQLATELPF